jgi:hypothetical protein
MGDHIMTREGRDACRVPGERAVGLRDVLEHLNPTAQASTLC